MEEAKKRANEMDGRYRGMGRKPNTGQCTGDVRHKENVVEKDAQGKKEVATVPVFESADQELAFWMDHDPCDFRDYWMECEIWLEHRKRGLIRVDASPCEFSAYVKSRNWRELDPSSDLSP